MENKTSEADLDATEKSASVVAWVLVGFAAFGAFTAVTKANKVLKARIEKRAIKRFQKDLELQSELKSK
jgi:hypothetical protein